MTGRGASGRALAGAQTLRTRQSSLSSPGSTHTGKSGFSCGCWVAKFQGIADPDPRPSRSGWEKPVLATGRLPIRDAPEPGMSVKNLAANASRRRLDYPETARSHVAGPLVTRSSAALVDRASEGGQERPCASSRILVTRVRPCPLVGARRTTAGSANPPTRAKGAMTNFRHPAARRGCAPDSELSSQGLALVTAAPARKPCCSRWACPPTRSPPGSATPTRAPPVTHTPTSSATRRPALR